MPQLHKQMCQHKTQRTGYNPQGFMHLKFIPHNHSGWEYKKQKVRSWISFFCSKSESRVNQEWIKEQKTTFLNIQSTERNPVRPKEDKHYPEI